MNYESNEIEWQVGDLVLHDADEKSELYLMRVIAVTPTGMIQTEYANRSGTQPTYLNIKEVLHAPSRFGILSPPDVQCASCMADLRPENTYRKDGKMFCDAFCAEHYEEQEGASPLAAGLHHDGTIHVYVKGVDSGLSIGLAEDGTLWITVDESKRKMKVSGR